MATTTTSKAKTKTTKKPASKTAAAKTTKSSVKSKATKSASATKKKTVSKKAPAKAAEVKKPAVTTNRSWNPLYVFSAVVLAVQAVLAVVLMKSDSAQVFLGHLTKNELASSASTVLAPAAYPIYEVEIRYVLALTLGVAAVFALLRGTRYLNAEIAGRSAKHQPLRWIELAVVGAFLFEIVGLLNGVQDLIAIKLGMLTVALGAYFAYTYERQAAEGKPVRANLIGAQLSFGLVALAVLGTMWGTYLYGMDRSPWSTYAVSAVFIAGLMAVLVNLRRSVGVSKEYYARLDSMYTIQAALVSVLIGALLIIGLYAK